MLDLGVEIPQIEGVDLILQLRHLIGGFFRIVGGDLVEAVDHRLFLRDAFHRVAQHIL